MSGRQVTLSSVTGDSVLLCTPAGIEESAVLTASRMAENLAIRFIDEGLQTFQY